MKTPAPASSLDAKVDGRTIHNRKRKLMAMQRRISKARNRQMIGREVDVLIEGPSAETDLLWQARMSTQAPEIDGFCYVNDFAGAPPRRGEIRRMRITEAHDYDLIGALDVASEGAVPVPAAKLFPILLAPRRCHDEVSHLQKRSFPRRPVFSLL